MLQHSDDFQAFCEYDEDDEEDGAVTDFETYVNRVRSTAEWGGHLELRVLSRALRRPIVVYSAQTATTKKPMIIADDSVGDEIDNDNPIRLSFHQNYYALGEHYNQVVPFEED